MDFRVIVRALIRKNNELLFLRQRRSRGARLSLPGGNVKASERPTKALIREVFEEVNLILKLEDLQFVHMMQATKSKQKESRIIMYFEVTKYMGTPINVEDHKFMSCEWLSVTDDLPINQISLKALQLIEAGELYHEFSDSDYLKELLK